MEEEKKEIIESKVNDNKIIVIILIVIGLILIGISSYKLLTKESGDNGTPSPTAPVSTEEPSTDPNKVLTNEEAIKIAKAKLEEANKFTSEDKCAEGESEIADEDGYWCYYGTVDEFKAKFYSIFSSNLVYKDVMMEYESFDSYELNDGITTNIKIEADYTAFPKYVIDGNKVYRSTTPSVGNGYYNRMDKFSVDSITSDTIKINYVVIGDSNPDEPNESKEYEYSKATMILVKENGDWKISKAAVQSMLYTTYEVGK